MSTVSGPIARPLFPYQAIGARFLAERGRALLADEMGLGKSAQAIVAARDLGVTYFLVVCPASVVENWHREIGKFWPHMPPGTCFNVVSYDRIMRDGGRTDWMGSGNNCLILDECHYLKTRTSKRTKAVFGDKCDGAGGLVSRARYVFLLSGTPTPNNPSEIWPLLRAVAPETITPLDKPLNYFAFVNRYCRLVNRGFGAQIVGGKNLADLRERIAPFVLRRKKDDVLKDIPPIRFDTLALEGVVPPAGQVLSAEAIEIAKVLEEHGVAGLRKIAPHVASLRRLTGVAKAGAALAWLGDWFGAGAGKIVVFAHHREVIAELEAGIDGIGMVVVDGSTPTSQRQKRVDVFQQDPSVRLFIGQIQAAGTGLTLTAASDVLFVESSWVPAENEQAAMRVHRIGQRSACLVRFAMLAGSIDERIQQAVMRKTADIARLFN